jgi:hypothetical protein
MTAILRDTERNNEREFETVEKAEEKRKDLIGMGASPEQLEIEENGVEAEHVDHTGNGSVEAHTVSEPENSDTVESDNPEGQPPAKQEPAQNSTVGLEMDTDAEQELRNLGGDFTTEIKGTTVIKKKGLRVMQQRYEIDVTSKLEVPPEETDHTYARAKAQAILPDGRIAEAHGSASVERGDDSFLLAEMSDTRAKSRALSDITGIGHAVVEEMQGVNDES